MQVAPRLPFIWGSGNAGLTLPLGSWTHFEMLGESSHDGLSFMAGLSLQSPTFQRGSGNAGL